MDKDCHTHTSDNIECQGDGGIISDNFWDDEIEIEDKDWDATSGSITAGNISINNNFLLPDAVDDILFYDKTYLVTKIDGEINSYKVDGEYGVKEINISDSYTTKMDCKPIDFEELPQYIRNSVLKEEI